MDAKNKKPAAQAADPEAYKDTSSQQFNNNTNGGFCQAALKKLDKKPKNLGDYGDAVADCVIAALKDFCRQSEEFAQAVAQSDKELADCIKYTVQGCGNAISDFEVYRRAAEFYFEAAKVEMRMTISTGEEPAQARKVEIDLDSLIDF